MVDIVKVTEILRLFLTFNYVEGSDSLDFEHSEYSDKFFRWTNETFKRKEKFTVMFNDTSIKMFDREKVADRLKANLGKLKRSPDGLNHACKHDVVKDLVLTIPINKLTETDIFEIDASIKRLEEAQAEGIEKLLNDDKVRTKKAMGTGFTKGSKLTNRVI